MKMNDVYKNWLIDGAIFTNMPEFPFMKYDALNLDIEYMGNWSGGKTISPLLSYICDGLILTTDKKKTISKIIYERNIENWTRLYSLLLIEYNPIDNYKMKEVEQNLKEVKTTDDLTTDSTHKNTMVGENSNDRKEDITDTENFVGSVNDDNRSKTLNDRYTHGFNTASPTPTSGETTTLEGINDITTSNDNEKIVKGVITDMGNTKNTTDITIKDETKHTISTIDKMDRTLSRTGNIGVTTTQQMITSEIKLWEWVFIETLFNDIDATLTLPIY